MSKRQLNIIYFVDSSKTRTIKIPLGRVSVVLLLLSAVGVWSVASAFVLNAAYADRIDMTRKLRTTLATVFDYETRHDGVYDLAYPNGKGGAVPTKSEPDGSVAPSVASALSRLPAAEPSATAEEADAAADGGEELAGAKLAPPKGLSAKAPPKARETAESKAQTKAQAKLEAKAEAKAEARAKAEADAKLKAEARAEAQAKTAADAKLKAEAKADAKAKAEALAQAAKADVGAKGTPIVVGNPVIENNPGALQVKFDLTNKSSDRAEGYIWAVAAFKNDKGEVSYIADPPNVGVQADGEVAEPSKSSNFGIRKFKKMSFTFPVKKELNGTFTGIRIGVTDKAGANRTTYNVPVEIKVGATDAAPDGTSR